MLIFCKARAFSRGGIENSNFAGGLSWSLLYCFAAFIKAPSSVLFWGGIEAVHDWGDHKRCEKRSCLWQNERTLLFPQLQHVETKANKLYSSTKSLMMWYSLRRKNVPMSCTTQKAVSAHRSADWSLESEIGRWPSLCFRTEQSWCSPFVSGGWPCERWTRTHDSMSWWRIHFSLHSTLAHSDDLNRWHLSKISRKARPVRSSCRLAFHGCHCESWIHPWPEKNALLHNFREAGSRFWTICQSAAFACGATFESASALQLSLLQYPRPSRACSRWQ